MARLATGAASGAVATVFMSAVMFAAKSAGLMGAMPPERITAHALDSLGIRRRDRTTQDVLSAISHVAFGAASGAVFALVERVPRLNIPAVPAGMLFGLMIWAVSYEGWVPALGIMPPAHRDRPGRPQAMLAGHLVYGAVLGALIGLSRDRADVAYVTAGNERPAANVS
jgi:hypothetical protein